MKSLSGILIINKPKGITSHDVVNRVRKVFGIRRVGHAGTLDPLATGVLVVMVGRATKLSKNLMAKEKEYVFEVEFGKLTTTGDEEGEVVEQIKLTDKRLATAEGAEKSAEALRLRELSANEVERIIPKFLGEIEQTVPLYSAVKVKGRRLYEIARSREKGTRHKAQGIKKKVIERPKRKVKIYELELLGFTPATKSSYPVAKFHTVCSKGTYIRSLAEDIGKSLSLPSYQKSLCRTRSGKFKLEDAITLEELEKSFDPSLMFAPEN